jgi:hypothetical protein
MKVTDQMELSYMDDSINFNDLSADEYQEHVFSG